MIGWLSLSGIGLVVVAILSTSGVGQYVVLAVIGFTLFGIGLGFYATLSTDAALANVPDDEVGAAAGIYNMASSLGSAIGVAVSAALICGRAGKRPEVPATPSPGS